MSNKTFRSTLAADFKRSLRLPMLFAVLAVIIGFIFDNYNDLKLLAFEQGRENLSVFYYHFNSVSFGGMFSTYLFALIAALPFAAEYAAERQSGVALYLVSRSGVKNYGISKMLTAAIAGGLALCLGSIIFVAVLSTQLPLVRPSDLVEHAGLPYDSLLASGTGMHDFLAAWYLLFLTVMGKRSDVRFGLCARPVCRNRIPLFTLLPHGAICAAAENTECRAIGYASDWTRTMGFGDRFLAAGRNSDCFVGRGTYIRVLSACERGGTKWALLEKVTGYFAFASVLPFHRQDWYCYWSWSLRMSMAMYPRWLICRRIWVSPRIRGRFHI